MSYWSIKPDLRVLRTSDKDLSMVTDLVKEVGGKIVLETVNGDGYVSFTIQGYMETDSQRLADRIARLIHSMGGRAKLHEEAYSSSRHLAIRSSKRTGNHPHFRHSVMTR